MPDRGSRETHSRSRSPTTRDDEEEFHGNAAGSAANAASATEDNFQHNDDRYVVDHGDEHDRNDDDWHDVDHDNDVWDACFAYGRGEDFGDSAGRADVDGVGSDVLGNSADHDQQSMGALRLGWRCLRRGGGRGRHDV